MVTIKYGYYKVINLIICMNYLVESVIKITIYLNVTHGKYLYNYIID
jgi:hypothetical protein